MRPINKILLLLLCSFATLLQSCMEKRDEPENSAKGVATLTIDVVSDKVSSRASNLSELNEEYTIQTLRIFAIDESGNVEINKYVDKITPSVTGSVYYSFDVVQDPKKLLYVVVNEPSSLTATLDGVRHQSELVQLNYEIAEALNNKQFISGSALGETNLLIPMSAKVEINASNDCRIVVHVDRVVARVDLMVDKDEVANTTNVKFDSLTSVCVNGLYYNTYLFKPPFMPTPTAAELKNIDGVRLSKSTSLSLRNESRSSAKRLFSFYMAERTYNLDEVNPSENRIAINIDYINVNGSPKEIDKTILLGNNVQPYIEQIDRNYVYRIYATYKGEKQSLEVDGEYAIKEWSVEELDGDIEGVMLAVTNQVVMDWVRLDNSFSANNIAFGSNRHVDIYVPTSYDAATGKYAFKLCNFVAHEGATYDLMDLSLFGVPDGENFLRTVPWLTHALVVFDSYQTGHFNLTYQLGNSPEQMDVIPLQLISANVRKLIEIRYDNGYVPGDLLQQNDVAKCWGDAPNGIIFAKRGDALHPIETESVLLRNEEGLYEGDITLSASEADQYCKSRLGVTWYAANRDQLADIQRHVLELGTSYRLNNGDNAIYWSSESAGNGAFWAINFAKGLVNPAAVSYPSTDQYHIRCIANL